MRVACANLRSRGLAGMLSQHCKHEEQLTYKHSADAFGLMAGKPKPRMPRRAVCSFEPKST